MHVGLGLNLGVGLGVGRAGPAYAYNYVVFDGADQLDNATNLGLAATFDTFTAAVAFRLNNLDTQVTLLGFISTAGLPLISVSGSGVGAVSLNAPTNFSNAGFVGATISGGNLSANTDYVIHVAADRTTQTVRCWVNGEERTVTASWLGGGSTTAMPRPTAWQIGGNSSGLTRLTGRMGLVWFDVGQYITNPAAFFPARALGANMENPGARPAIGFGDAQTATNWNAGTNLGDGTGTWTMTGGV
jgi:hypothetical protein